jgi:hypothetical protein
MVSARLDPLEGVVPSNLTPEKDETGAIDGGLATCGTDYAAAVNNNNKDTPSYTRDIPPHLLDPWSSSRLAGSIYFER